jgi:hypothetical protein
MSTSCISVYLNRGQQTLTDYRFMYVSRICVISGFRREVDNCAPLGCYAASSGNSLPAFRDKLLVPSFKCQEQFLALEDGTNRLSRNVGKESTA